MPRFFADRGCVRLAVGRAVAAAFVAACAAAAAASSPDAPSDTLDLPPAATRGARVAPPAEGVHHLDGEALRRFATLEDALASLPGFRVRRAGGLGGYSELSFRGARASAVEVYVDGVRLNQDGDGAPDLSKWPSLWFSSLTARTGFDGDGASPGALARLDLSTRSAHRAEAHARGGSFGAAEAAAQASFPWNPSAPGWRLTVGVQGQAARNDYPVFSDNGTLYNTADDTTYRMGNNAYASRGARASARREDAEGSHEVSVLWLDSRKEYPGLFPAIARAHTLRTEWLAAWRLARAPGAGSWEAGAQARRLEDSYRDPNQTLGAFSFEQARVSFAGELDAAARLPFALGEPSASRRFRGDARVDLRLRAEDIDPTATPFTQQMASPAASRHEAGGGARLSAVALPMLPAALTVTLEARPAWVRFEADGVRSFPSGPVSAPVSKAYAPVALRAAAEWPTFAGTWGVAARREPRAPSSGEFLGDNNGIQHNPALRAEEARSLSVMHAFERRAAGGDAAAWSLRATTALYANFYEDPIRLAQRGASPFLRHENGADYRARGAEWTGFAALPLLEASLSLSMQDAEISEGPYAGNRPAHLSEAEAHAEAFLKPVAGARLGPLLDFRSPYYPGDANVPVSRRAAEWEVGAHAGYARGPARLALDARNLLDRRYADFARSPRSGRAWSLTLSFAL